MKKIGIVICNYNKKDYVLNCIRSVLESKNQDFDLYVADNASTDGSVEAIKETYGDAVTVLVNPENLGGSGGFNLGIRKILEEGYEYLCCLDNDILVDENAIGALADYLDAHPDTGVCGSIVYHMDYPDYVQQYGLDLDFDNFTAITHYADYPDDGNIPEVNECDTVATCSVMLRTRFIKESDIGIMPEDNFIYWDDMEWCYRFHLAGYKVVTIKDSVVLHKMGSNAKPVNTFINYYMWRNRIHFFMKYTPEEKLDHMSYCILSSAFDAMYESMYREEHNIMQTISYAYYDAIRDVRGKASDGKIRNNDASDSRFQSYLQTKKTYYLKADTTEEEQEAQAFIEALQTECQRVEQESDADVTIVVCPYIMRCKREQYPEKNQIVLDSYKNVILDESDWEAVSQYDYAKSLFIYMNQGAFLEATKALRK